MKTALASEPDNPRWLCFFVRDGFVALGRDSIVEACTRLRELASSGVHTADLLSARDYQTLILPAACQALIALGDLRTAYRYCDELDELEADTPDACAPAPAALTVAAAQQATANPAYWTTPPSTIPARPNVRS
ncbi:hypothetical protein [Kibdelosporangium phytohabitans]|uniref:Bacterial transcriptional activator domain-containing protein n=1 Tax=Kibdelosporangium phytohabitans TaxID=860235 RepID=A0A0N9I398_9PSEU|nr:hypothetical protein [Kibdelosporangium phytohabitans]ALG10521.1 hypothetical protein AOZ06_29750 [Kibdelosporangium phytohabitans]MBE1461616.1 hypothetical protein [Kibdelosporangium phytohabitans]